MEEIYLRPGAMFVAAQNQVHADGVAAVPFNLDRFDDVDPSEFILELAQTELRRAHEHFTGEHNINVDDAMVYRFLWNHFDRETRLGQVYPWLFSFLFDPELTPERVEAAGAIFETMMEARWIYVGGADRYTANERRLFPPYRAALLRENVPNNLPRFEIAHFGIYAVYAVIEFLYFIRPSYLNPQPIRERILNPKNLNADAVLRREIGIFVAHVGPTNIEHVLGQADNLADLRLHIEAHFENKSLPLHKAAEYGGLAAFYKEEISNRIDEFKADALLLLRDAIPPE